jgi:hypothetical protein
MMMGPPPAAEAPQPIVDEAYSTKNIENNNRIINNG